MAGGTPELACCVNHKAAGTERVPRAGVFPVDLKQPLHRSA